MIDFILEEDVTPELILLAQEAPDDEWHNNQILRIIGGGNPNPSIQSALTNFSLQEILLPFSPLPDRDLDLFKRMNFVTFHSMPNK